MRVFECLEGNSANVDYTCRSRLPEHDFALPRVDGDRQVPVHYAPRLTVVVALYTDLLRTAERKHRLHTPLHTHRRHREPSPLLAPGPAQQAVHRDDGP